MKYIKCKYRNAELNVAMDEDENFFYQNPTTGEWTESIQQCFQGWAERTEDDATDWAILETEILKCDVLGDLIADADEGEVKEFK